MRQSVVLWGLSFLMFAGLVHVGCGERGSGVAASDSRSVAAFEEIEVSGEIDLRVDVGDETSVELSGDDNIVPRIRAEVDGGRLVIRSSGHVSPELPIVVRVTTPELRAVVLHGASKATIRDIDAQRFELTAHGASSASLDGEADELSLELHGASTVDAESLEVDRASVESHGASSVALDELDELEVELHGASVVTHRGHPTLQSDLHGASRVSVR